MATKSTTKTTPDTVKTRIGDLQYERGFPTEETTHKVFDEIDYQRAVQAYLWAYPAVSLESIRIAAKAGAMDLNVIGIADKYADAGGSVVWSPNSFHLRPARARRGRYDELRSGTR